MIRHALETAIGGIVAIAFGLAVLAPMPARADASSIGSGEAVAAQRQSRAPGT